MSNSDQGTTPPKDTEKGSTILNHAKSIQSKNFRFVNNSPNSMVKPNIRMKPAFKVQQTKQSVGKNVTQSLMIEQTFHKEKNDDRQYVFQLGVKRPPGRPRKYPTVNKIKRPQGRPRKYQLEADKKVRQEDVIDDIPVDSVLQEKTPKEETVEAVAVAAVASLPK